MSGEPDQEKRRGVGSRSAANASSHINTSNKRKAGMQPLQNDKGNTTLGALPPNVDRGRTGRATSPNAIHDTNLFGVPEDPHSGMRGLKREFVFPPFSVLNTREGNWQARKRAWIRLGIQSELGRGEDGTAETEIVDGKYGRKAGQAYGQEDIDKLKDKVGQKKWMKYNHPGGGAFPQERIEGLKKQIAKQVNGRAAGTPYGATTRTDETSQKIMKVSSTATGVSIFDPVLCELAYRWFCPPGGQVLDPFAGGSVRGIVASCLGRKYLGCDLSERQIKANRQQVHICKANEHQPVWVSGDSRRIKAHARGVDPEFAADMVFGCPPYADLETYSRHPDDISAMDYEEFLEAYRLIIRKACGLLKPNTFAVWVVGEVRDTRKVGSPYYSFVPDTIKAFQDAGLEYYNELILVTAIGSLPLRTRGGFHSARKIGKTHQNCLVFVKGDPKKATFPI